MSDSDQDSGPSQFRTTAWSVVVGAQQADDAARERCLSVLCRNYWKPIYYYMRRRGLSHEDALDLTQEYFATFLEKNFVAAADRERGRFRTFVLVTVNRFLSKQLAKRERREARRNIMLPAEEGEEELVVPELTHGETAEDDFNRRWALSLIESALKRMREECGGGRKFLYYDTFRMYLESTSTDRAASYRDMAKTLGVSETDVTNFLHRGRNIFQKLLREEICQSVTRESEIDEEIEALKEYLRR
jgi:DNA-directed RNA polymerase specialized sigma24 family protein